MEEEQIRLLDQIYSTESTVSTVSIELSSMRQQTSMADQSNLNVRKEVEYQEGSCNEQKGTSHTRYEQLAKYRDCSMKLDKELEA